jgi:endonuclease/exonuclease/phosphatase family metal-dependent hydrolase
MNQKISIISWNILLGKPFPRVTAYLKKHLSDVICLQEMPLSEHKMARLKKLNGYNLALSSFRKGESGSYVSNIILSRLPIINSGEIEFPQLYDYRIRGYPKWRERTIVIFSDIKASTGTLRIYNCHLRISQNGIRERLADVKEVYEHAKQFAGPVIICGDMNTSITKSGIYRKVIMWFHKMPKESLSIDGQIYTKDERYVFTKVAKAYSYQDILPIEHSTWAIPETSIELFNLKLDWFLTKNISNARASLGPYISDHRPVLAEVEI